jgi:hypothetical protein
MKLPHLHEKTAAECWDVWLLIEVRDLERARILQKTL